MPRTTATVTAKGIKFNSLYYTNAHALKNHWFQKARSKGTWKIRIAYDARHIDAIYLIDEKSQSFQRAEILRHR